MDSISGLPQQIIEALERGWIVLTANQRAARSLRHAFDLRQRSLRIPYWEPPHILAWDAWLKEQWHRLLMDGRVTDLLLNSSQEQTLWRAIIAADSFTASLRPVDSLAQTAADAWQRLHQFRARQLLQKYPGNSDTGAFARWVAEFDRRCTRAHYLTEAQLPDAIRSAVVAGHLAPNAGMLQVGFDSIKPAQTALLDALRATGLDVEELAPPSVAPSLTLADAPDDHSELTACARWLRTRLTDQPTSSIAVIHPSIETSRAEIDRVFRHILAPELNDVGSPTVSGPFEFSLGVPLSTTAIAATALELLRWSIAPLSLARVSALLRSPYFAAGAQAGPERLARAEFDAFVLCDQHLLVPQLTLDAVYNLASDSRNGAAGLTSLREHLRTLAPLFRNPDHTIERSHAEWAAAIHELLEAAGWAIPSHLDSIEFQTRRKWESALDELATLDFESARIPFPAALAALERIAAQTLFAPESRHAPVQIMGPLESAGSSFDAVWFLRANDSAWPSTSGPNPLLSWALQNNFAMGGADPGVDAARARHITERIATGATTVLFSYAHESSDGPLRPSPAVVGLPLDRRSTSEVAPEEVIRPPIELEIIPDNDPIQPPPEFFLRGGASILQEQAACGFRAFAEKRLFSSTPDTIELGLDARERGSLVHKILELFWTQVRTQDTLRQMSLADRNAILTRSIKTALTQMNRAVDPGWPQAFFATERRRLFRLLDAWLTLELTRPAFEVKAMEQQLAHVPIGPLHLDVRVDRVDTSLLNGEPAGDIILDYKTGTVAPADWLSDRPDEPQLPLYAVVSQPNNIAAVAFASVRAGEDQPLKGYEARKGVIGKATKLKTDSLQAQIEKWKEVLETLAENFHAGDARVAPKQYPSTCRYCRQRLLCRLDLSTLEADANEDFVDASDPVVDTLEPTTEVEHA